MPNWTNNKSSIAERLVLAAAQFKAAVPTLLETQVKAVQGMAKVVRLAEQGRPK